MATKQQGINPITVRGTRSFLENEERCLALGRLWITATDAREGQHRFDPLNSHRRLDKTMQFVLYEGDDNILAFMLGDEMDFLPGMKAMLAGRANSFFVTGTSARRGGDKRKVVFRRDPFGLTVEIITIEGELLSTVLLDYEHYCGGLKFLFPNGELG